MSHDSPFRFHFVLASIKLLHGALTCYHDFLTVAQARHHYARAEEARQVSAPRSLAARVAAAVRAWVQDAVPALVPASAPGEIQDEAQVWVPVWVLAGVLVFHTSAQVSVPGAALVWSQVAVQVWVQF
jgi:hypothetical protein